MVNDADIARQPIFSSADTPLPFDALGKSADRVRIAAGIGVATAVVFFTMNELVVRFADMHRWSEIWGPLQRTLILTAMAGALVLLWLASRLRSKPQLILDLGLVFFVLVCLVISVLTERNPRKEPQAVTWVCVAIVFWAAIAPSTPRKTLVAALAAASTVPLAMWYSHLVNPRPLLSWFALAWLILPGYMCALLAVAPATIIRRLSQQIGKLRELGSYQLEERIGKGGMGEVYRAKHRLLARPAAVKLISPAALSAISPDANRVVVERFRREAEAAAMLHSPHTIELYDYGVSRDGSFYYVMELLDGIDLSELVKRYGPIPAERVLYLMRQACDSLGEAHLQGLVHRDVKPSNILACRLGLNVDYVKVLDFGLVKKDAKHAVEQMDLTTSGLVHGTPAFMAPESVTAGEVYATADVYALGCVAYWLLTGQYVFEATNATIMMMQHIQRVPVRPSLRTDQPVPLELEDIVMRCLSKDPAERPSDAAELGRLFDKCQLPLAWTDLRAREWWNVHREAIGMGSPKFVSE